MTPLELQQFRRLLKTAWLLATAVAKPSSHMLPPEAANVGTEEVEVTLRPFEEETMPASGSFR